MLEQIQFIFSIVVGILGLLVISLLIFSYKSNKIVNIYLAIVFIIASTRSIISVSDSFIQFSFLRKKISAINSIALIAIPCL